MPEGPEIWRAADEIKKAISGRKIEKIFFAFEKLKEFENRLVGVKVEAVIPRGKAIITSFENELNLYTHNQLYGKWVIQNRGEFPDTNRSLRVALHTENKSALLYSASEIEMLKNAEVETHPYIKKLGPDVVHPDTTIEVVSERYHSEKFQNRKLATLLLDQEFLSGVGNYLRSEILFCSGVDPAFCPKDCSKKQIQKLAEYSLKLPRRSYETGGLTTPNDLVKALKEEGAGRKEYRHYVFRRGGRPCYKCGREIKMLKTGGRKLFYCETEQK